MNKMQEFDELITELKEHAGQFPNMTNTKFSVCLEMDGESRTWVLNHFGTYLFLQGLCKMAEAGLPRAAIMLMLKDLEVSKERRDIENDEFKLSFQVVDESAPTPDTTIH